MQPCHVCKHHQRAEIDAAILRGESNYALARQYGIGHDSIRNHRITHVAGALAHIDHQQAQRVAAARNILREIEECWEDVWLVRNKLRPIIERGESPDLDTIEALLKTIAQARGNVQTSINTMALAMDWERRQEEKAAAQDSGTELRDLVAEALPPEILQAGVTSILEEAGLGKVAGKVAEVLAPRLGEWIVSQFEGTGE